MFKRCFALMIMLAISAVMFSAPVFAGTGAEVTVGSAAGNIGENVDIPLIISGNTGFSNLGLEVAYDTSALKLVKVIPAGGVGANFTKAQNQDTMPYNMSWDSASDTRFNGTLVTLTFRIISEKDGTYPITVDYYKGRNGDYEDGKNVNYDENFSKLNLKYNCGSITVGGRKSGEMSVSKNGSNYTLELSGDYTVGTVYAAVYDRNNKMISLTKYPASKSISAYISRPAEGEYVKFMWWNYNLDSMCEFQRYSLR